MRLLLLLLSSTAAFASSIKRDLKGFTLAGYSPLSSAVDVAALDLDQKEMEKQMALGEFANAKNVYSGGGHSMRAAWLILKNLSGAAHLKKGAKVTGPRKINQFTPEDAPSEINGFLAEDYSWDDKKLLTHIEVFYDADAPPTTCMVGDMFAFSGATLEGCKLCAVDQFSISSTQQFTHPQHLSQASTTKESFRLRILVKKCCPLITRMMKISEKTTTACSRSSALARKQVKK